MKTKLLLPILLCILVGFFMGTFLFNQYDNAKTILPVFGSTSQSLYFLQQGVYSSLESMNKNTTDFSHYIYNVSDGKYYVYIGITKDEENLTKLKGYYEQMGYVVYVKEITVKNEAFLEVFEQYEILLSKTEDKQAIGAIINQVLAKYEELVITDEH